MFTYQVTNKAHRDLGDQATQRNIYNREIFGNSIRKFIIFIIRKWGYPSEGKGRGASSVVCCLVPAPCEAWSTGTSFSLLNDSVYK